MTIVPFLHGRTFGPEDIKAMSTALEDVCKILRVADESKSERELVAKTIVALAHRGEADASFLRDQLLREIASGQGKWPKELVRSALRWAL